MFPRTSLVTSLILAVVATGVSGNSEEELLHGDRRVKPFEGNRCPPLSPRYANVTCMLANEEVACKYILPGTIAKVECKHFFKPAYTELTCLEHGDWDQPLVDCIPECGISYSDSIRYGVEARPGAFPWHAGLYYRTRKRSVITWEQKCSGTLISDQFVITVAHCVADTKEEELRVALGKYYSDWYNKERGEQHRSVSKIIYQRDFSKTINSFGIAIVRMNERVEFGKTIMPVCHGFPGGSPHLGKSDLYVVGWGRTEEGCIKRVSDYLLFNSVTVVNEHACRNHFPSVYPTYDKFCTINSNQSRAYISQPGNNGGGITAVHDGLHFLLGVAGVQDKRYSVFTNFTWPYNVIWIESVMRSYYPHFRWDENSSVKTLDSGRGCILPGATYSRKFCSLAEGCRNCDRKDPLCFLPPGTLADRVRVECQQDYTLRSPHKYGDVALCLNGQWYPEVAQCDRYRYIPGSPWAAVTWQEARDNCAEKGHLLATIKNKREEETFKETVLKTFTAVGMKPDYVWIGLSDLKNEKTFEWVDGSILSNSSFSSWQKGEPSEYNHNVYPAMYLEHCVEALKSCKNKDDCFHWNDNYCSDLNYYFCKETVPWDANFDDSSDIGEVVPTPKPRYAYLPGSPWSKVTWYEAKDNCMAKGRELAIVRNPDQQKLFEEAVEKQFKYIETAPESIWIGLKSANFEGSELYSWVDGSVYDAWRGTWNNWIRKRSNWNWDCTEAAAGDTLKSWPHASIYQWNDVSCSDKNYYFCSVKL